MSKLKKLFEGDLKIVENKKKAFLIPVLCLVAALIAGFIFLGVTGSFMNLGMDITGEYRTIVRYGARLSDDTYETYKRQAVDFTEALADEDGTSYGLKVEAVSRQGDSANAAIVLRYRVPKGKSDDDMAAINTVLTEKLADRLFSFRPVLSYDGAKVTASFDTPVLGDDPQNLANKLTAAGFTLTGEPAVSEDQKSVTFTLGTAPDAAEKTTIENCLYIADSYAGQAIESSRISGRLSGDALGFVGLAVIVALILVCIYIAVRFDAVSAVATLFALICDAVIVLSLMTVFHIEISALGVAAFVALMCFTLINSVMLFDRIRENRKLFGDKRINGKLVKPAYIANKSVQETLPRTLSITAVLLIPALVLLWPVWLFALPLIFGLIAGTFSVTCIAPSVWAMLKVAFPGKLKTTKPKRVQRAKNRDREKLEV